jgi:AcrR family transcriptional regulator
MATPPKQARSIATEQKMLAAAEELLQNGDPQHVTVENVVRLSGSTVGSFYARFGNVEGLFEALHKRYLDSIFESKLISATFRSIAQPDLKSSLRDGYKTILEFGYKNRKLLAYFITHPSDDALMIRRVLVDSMLNNLKAHRSEVAHKDLKRASENAMRLVHMAFVGVVFLDPSDFVGRKTSLSSLIDTYTQMTYLYLTNE